MIVWWCKHDSEPSNAWRSRKCCTLWSLNNSRVLRHGLHKTCMQVSSNKMRVAQLSPEVLLFALSRTHSLLEADPCAHLHPDCRCDWRLSSKVICQVRCSMLSHVLNSCRPAMWSHCTCRGLTEVGPVFPTSLATSRWLYPHVVVQDAYWVGQFYRQVWAASVLPPNVTICNPLAKVEMADCKVWNQLFRTFLLGESAGTVTVLDESTDTISLDAPFKL